MPERRRITVVGLSGDGLPPAAAAAVRDADLVVGGRRHLDAVETGETRRLAIGGDIDAVLRAMEDGAGGERVCVLASGDPGFFGIVRALAGRFGPEALDVHPAPSSVSLAFARLGLPWDDALVVSAHGRPLAEAARRAASATKAAVLTSPDASPAALGRELAKLGSSQRAVVCSRLGEADEAIAEVDVRALAGGTWDDRSVVVLLPPAADGERGPDARAGVRPAGVRPNAATGVAAQRVLSWGRPEDDFLHRRGLVTKAEVRAVALGKLGLPPAGVLWDVGAGSGSVALECGALAPRLRILAIERDAAACQRIGANAATHGVTVEVVEGAAPEALAPLPDPDRAFVGGGGLDVLDAVIARLRTGGRVVATFAALDRAAPAFARLGQLCQVSVSRGEALPDGGVRLVATNPVFVVWGPVS